MSSIILIFHRYFGAHIQHIEFEQNITLQMTSEFYCIKNIAVLGQLSLHIFLISKWEQVIIDLGNGFSAELESLY